MKILFTGASSFTGCWFVRELAHAGHDVVMTFRRDLHEYDGIRQARVDLLKDDGRTVSHCAFGDSRFMQLVEGESQWGPTVPSRRRRHRLQESRFRSLRRPAT